jgi:hypothetical protein
MKRPFHAFILFTLSTPALAVDGVGPDFGDLLLLLMAFSPVVVAVLVVIGVIILVSKSGVGKRPRNSYAKEQKQYPDHNDPA